MNISEEQIKDIVRKVISQTIGNQPPAVSSTDSDLWGVYENINDAIDLAYANYLSLRKDYSMADRQRFIDAIKEYTLSDKEKLARMVVDETGLGNYEDKLKKHELAAMTPGTEVLQTTAKTGDTGLAVIEEAPFGVIGATTPVTNPTETIVNNTISMLAAGNTVVFNVHPSSKNCCAYIVDRINRVIVNAGGPNGLITMVKNPTMDSLNALAESPRINLLMGTGGPGLVKTLLKSGKKAIGAGAGNPPVIVDSTAILDKAAADIIKGHSFDNNIVCILEKEVFVQEEVANNFISEMQKNGAFLLNAEQVSKLMSVMLIKNENDTGGKKPYLTNKDWVGKDPYKYLDAIGASYQSRPKCLICETDFMHPFVQLELLMPILPIVRVSSFDQALDMAVEAEHGNRHTAVIHSQNIANITRFAKAVNTTIFVKNGPSLAGLGIGSEGTCSFSIAGPTGEGITTARTFTRARHCVLVDGFRII